MIRRLFRECTANVAPLFAIAAIPLVLSTGAVVDYTNAYRQQIIVQDALDSAALAANRLVGLVSETKVKDEAEAIFRANTAGKVTDGLPLTVKIEEGSVEASTTLHVPTYFLGMAGIAEHIYNLRARSIAGAATYEVVMVLDNSGSMSGSKISSLRTAAKDLTKVLFEVNRSNPKPDPIKIGLVPFAAAVNVGQGYGNASWMDGTAVGPQHSENFDENANRFDLFDELRNVSWQGCVEARPHPYDVTDDSPSPGVPATMFVPMFAVDEPDSGNFPNDYLDDEGGDCPSPGRGGRGRWGGRGGGGGGGSNLSDPELQARICKYDNESLSGTHQNGIRYGPNYNCTAEPLQPLTSNRGKIESEIAKMKADGMTNIHGGIMWGWRLLSQGSPFTEGRPYRTDDNRKIMIVMTDGMNTYSTYNTFNKSMYGAFGFVAKGHLGTTSSDDDKVVGKMNERTREACTNVKATGSILVYTIAFQVNDRDTLGMLQECATNRDMAFRSQSNSELVDTFRQIAKDISLLRLEK
jgi:Mg-chelatase subunit ChlD